jgi:hypothetical protein
MRLHRLVPSVILLLLAGSLVPAQPSVGRGPVRGGPSAFATLRQKAVMAELKLTEEQTGRMKQALMALREKMLDAIETKQSDKAAALVQEQEKAIFKLLTPDQGKRLRELVHQVHGLWAMTLPETADTLKLTAEQRAKLKELQAETEKQMNQLFRGAAETRTEAQKKLAEMHIAATEKGVQLLTADQQAKWKALNGAPFKGEIQRVAPDAGRGKS